MRPFGPKLLFCTETVYNPTVSIIIHKHKNTHTCASARPCVGTRLPACPRAGCARRPARHPARRPALHELWRSLPFCDRALTAAARAEILSRASARRGFCKFQQNRSPPRLRGFGRACRASVSPNTTTTLKGCTVCAIQTWRISPTRPCSRKSLPWQPLEICLLYEIWEE